MSFIDVQIAGVLLGIAVSFVRSRPGLLVFSLGHLFALIGFRAIEAGGQPDDFYYLPDWLYEDPNLSIALDVTAMGTLLLVVASLLPGSSEARVESIPPLPPAALWLVGAYFVAYFFSTRTVFETSYATADQGSTALGGGVYTLVWAVLLLELRRRVEAGMSPRLALAGVAVALFFLDFLKGSTGLAAGIFVTALIGVYIPGVTKDAARAIDRWKALARSAAGLLVAGLAIMFARGMRTSLSQVGVGQALSNTFTSLTSSFDTAAISTWANGDQGAAHVLMCTALQEHGFDREWRSITGALEYTYKPSILVRYLGLQRSPEAAWELMGHFPHGGGVNIFGELYWNGGWPCMIVMGLAVVGTILYIDRGAHHSVWLLALSFAITPNLVQGYGYGYAQTFRGLANGLFFMLPLVSYLRFVEWGRSRQQLRVQSPFRATAGPASTAVAR